MAPYDIRVFGDPVLRTPADAVTEIDGDLVRLADDPVELVGPDGVVVARGLVAYDSRELPALLGRKTADLDPEFRREVVHRDEMVLVRRPSLG